jgi:signal-transduction protein with cAMP-binding, CBS, and nucleotidyltransferase domain
MATETSLLFPVARERLGPVARQRLRDALARFDDRVQTQKAELQRLLERVVPEHDEQTVEECGSSPVIAIGVEMQAADALNLADERGIHHLPIVSRGQVVSVICTCDLHELAPTTVVATVAQRPPVAIEAGASCNEAAAMMSASAVGSLLVVQDGAPIGIVTRNDLVRHDVATSYLLEWKCTCCGATRHLHRDRHGLNLCVECLERAESRIECDVGVGD